MIPAKLWLGLLLPFVLPLIPPWAGTLHGAQGGDGSRRLAGPPPTASSDADPASTPALFITGTVMQEDGMPAPKRTRVECACNSGSKRSVTVDSRGFFSLQMGGNSRFGTLTPDANPEPSNSMDTMTDRGAARLGLPAWLDSMSSDRMTGCELHATLDGFRSNMVNLEGAKGLGQLDVGTIVLYPVSSLPGTLVSVTSLQAPKQAKKSAEKAANLLKKGDIGKAERELDKAVQIYPRYAEAWLKIGQIKEQERHIQDARNAYQKAIAADGNYVKPYVALARLAGIERHWKEVAEITDHAVALNPVDVPEAYYLNSVAYYSLKNLDEAERSARKVLRLDPLHRIPSAYLILADILEQRRDYTGSIEQLRNYLQILPNSPSADVLRAKIKALEKSTQKGT